MAPHFEFPVPVLSVAADAVRELEGREALSGLWALFTKCKQSIKDGHRLENLSWRLWYRELALAASRAACEEKELRWSDAAPTPLDSSCFDEKKEMDGPHTSRIPETSSSPCKPSLAITAFPTRPPLCRRNSSVGQLIIDILPATTLPNTPSALHSESSPAPNISHPTFLSPPPQLHSSSSAPPAIVAVSAPHEPLKLPPTHPPSNNSSSLQRVTAQGVKAVHSLPVSVPTTTATGTLTPSAQPEVPGSFVSARSSSAPEADLSQDQTRISLLTPSPHPHGKSTTPLLTPSHDQVIITPPPSISPEHVHGSDGNPIIITSVAPRQSSSDSATATPTGPLLPRLVIVHPTPGATPHPTPPATPRFGGRTPEESLPLSVDSESGGLLTPSESLFSEITETSVTTSGMTTTFEEDANMGKNDKSDTVVAGTQSQVGTKDGAEKPGSVPRNLGMHTRKGSASSAPDSGVAVVQTKNTHNSGRSRTRGVGRIAGVGRSERHLSKSSSRSRSPGAGAGAGAGVGVGGLAMAMTAVKPVNGEANSNAKLAVQAAKKITHAHAGSKPAAKRLGMGIKRTMSTGRVGTAAAGSGGGHDKRASLNVGLNFEDGSGAGSPSHSKGGSDAGTRIQELPVKMSSPEVLVPAQAHKVPSVPAAVQPLQQQQTRHLVLATDDSEDYETETDTDIENDGASGESPAQEVAAPVVPDPVEGAVQDKGREENADEGEWASEESSAEEKPVEKKGTGPSPISPSRKKQGHGINGVSAGRAKGQQQVQPRNQHSSPQHHHGRQRQPATGQHHRNARLMQAEAQARRAQHTIEQAALKTERLQEMFVRKPVPSSEQLAEMRSKSVGLLTQLLNPDPRMFPIGHPCRRGFSSAEVPSGLGHGAERRRGDSARASDRLRQPGGIAAALSDGPLRSARPPAIPDPPPPAVPNPTPVKVTQAVQPRPPTQANPNSKRRSMDGTHPPPSMIGVTAPRLRMTKSSAALPVASQVQVGSVASLSHSETGGPVDDAAKFERKLQHAEVKSGYRPRGRPADQELEDTESEDEGGTNSILLSKSVAQEKLKALAQKRGIKAAVDQNGSKANGEETKRERGEQARVPKTVKVETGVRQQPEQQHPILQQRTYYVPNPPPAPIPVGHPYNLPPPAPPSTPRTTRRHMLQTEMSESLRRNLLWERQVSNVNMNRFRRTHSTGGGVKPGGNVLGGLQPLTENVVRLTAKTGNGTARPAEDVAPKPLDQAENERRALARTKSWANDFHLSGW